MMNFYKILFLLTLMMGTLISISSHSWLGMWIGLEMNLLSIIPLMNNSKNLLSSEASLKYFITQALASLILMFSLLLMMFFQNFVNNLIYQIYPLIIMNSALLTKMGAAPFHFWLPEVIEGLNWMNSLILLTWQKIAPLVLFMYNIKFSNFITLIIITSMIISGIMGLNQISLRKILAYSSINHLGWMISSFLFMEKIWLYYFLIYSIISINLVLIFFYMNTFYLKQLFLTLNNNPQMKFLFMMNFFSLGGLPPFLGFLPKWMTIQMLVENNFFLLSLIMIMMTLITLFFYMRISFSGLLLNIDELNFKLNQFYSIKFNLVLIFNIITLLMLIICTLMFNWL